jgi:ATP-dependent RNA helicase DeaD
MIEVEPHGKLAALDRVLQAEKPKCALVFARTKLGAARLTDDLLRKDYRVRALHGDLSQSQRDSVMIAFRAGRVPLLVATDVASRGLDVSQITHVVNYDLPDDAEVYVHRIGRTGRVGRDGAAISLVSRKEARKLADILALTGRPITPWSPPGDDESKPDAVLAAPQDGPRTNGSGPVAVADRSTRDHAAGRADRPRRRRRARRGASNPSSPSAPTANSAPSSDSATSTPPSG